MVILLYHVVAQSFLQSIQINFKNNFSSTRKYIFSRNNNLKYYVLFNIKCFCLLKIIIVVLRRNNTYIGVFLEVFSVIKLYPRIIIILELLLEIHKGQKYPFSIILITLFVVDCKYY